MATPTTFMCDSCTQSSWLPVHGMQTQQPRDRPSLQTITVQTFLKAVFLLGEIYSVNKYKKNLLKSVYIKLSNEPSTTCDSRTLCFVVVGILIWYRNKQHFELTDVVITRDYCSMYNRHNDLCVGLNVNSHDEDPNDTCVHYSTEHLLKHSLSLTMESFISRQFAFSCST